MTTKRKIIQLLESNIESYVSGEEIAENLGVSRTAIWKAVTGLREDGYNIDAVRNKGYKLARNTDILSREGILKYIPGLSSEANSVGEYFSKNTDSKVTCHDAADSSDSAISTSGFDHLDISVLQEVNSTNTYLAERALEGAASGTIVVAGSQSAGRGRRGRAFSSPAGSGVYLSILLRPSEMKPEDAVRITTIAAVAVCESIEAASGRNAGIKWVNDVFIDGKKVCGILTEASFGPETGSLEYIIVGIGVNVYLPEGGFDPAIRDIAGAVFDDKQSDGRNRIAAGIISSFMTYYEELQNCELRYIDEYRKRSLAIGRQIQVLKPDGPMTAEALDIDNDCHLIVKYADGSTETLSSGEISIKL